MSNEFEVRTRFGTLGDFDALVTEWWSSIPVPAILDQGGNDYAWVFAPGESIRGCSVTMGTRRLLGRSYHVRLSIAASRTDWRIAYAFLRLAKARGGNVLSDSGTSLQPNDLADAAADERANEAFPVGIRLLQRMIYEQEQDPLTLPNTRFSTVITRDDLPNAALSAEEIERLRTTLASRSLRFRGARVAATITLKNGRTAIVWDGDAVLGQEVEFIIFPRTPEEPDMEDYVYLPTSTALEKLGSEATLIKGQVPSLFLPRLDPNAPVWEMLRAEARYIDELSSE